MDKPEFKVEFFDVNGDEATVMVWKLGGGTVGKKYEGSWQIKIDGVYGCTGVMDLRSGISRSHFGVAMTAYEWYLEDNCPE